MNTLAQAGLLAAAGLQALDDFEKGMLKDDHDRALIIAKRLSELPGLNVDVQSVDTNIVLVNNFSAVVCISNLVVIKVVVLSI